MKVLVAGFQHETNTFAPTRADWNAFLRGDSFPPFSQGSDMLEKLGGSGLPIGGFVTAARERGWQLVPSAWMGATPSAHITDDAWARILATLLRDARASAYDAIYLDLHGAAVTESIDDAEGELLAQLRAVAGEHVPIVASLDLHANVTQRMLALADGLVAYRTYPHVDMAETGRLAAQLLERRLLRGSREPMQVRRLPFLLPVNVQSTLMEPAASIYRELAELDARHGSILNFTMGFPIADIEECGPVVWGYGDGAGTAVERLFARIAQPRSQWRLDLLSPQAAIAEALALGEAAQGPVVIADTQDNPGGGGDSNTTGMLHALAAAQAGRRWPQQVALGLLCAPRAAEAAHAAGVGATLRLSLGASVPTFGGQYSDEPVQGDFVVRALGAGRAVLKGPIATGQAVELGPCACLDYQGILIAVASHKVQMLDRELFRCTGIAPEDMKILVVKSSVHFRADFAPIAAAILVAKAPGPMAADPSDLPWRKLAPSTARRP